MAPLIYSPSLFTDCKWLLSMAKETNLLIYTPSREHYEMEIKLVNTILLQT